jgi:hypothetical protein
LHGRKHMRRGGREEEYENLHRAVGTRTREVPG